MQDFGLNTCLRLVTFSFVAMHSQKHDQVQLVILVSIDPPVAPYPNLPRITIQLWKGFPPCWPLCSPTGRQREARMVWEANWTHAATPLYILLSDIFRGQVPAAYGNNDHVHLNTADWRQAIIEAWQP
jgi:hypothetical protein